MTAVAAPERARDVLLVGPESAGKSTLASCLTGVHAEAANLRGTTVAVERYPGPAGAIVDTPGLTLGGDSEAMRRTLDVLGGDEPVAAVVRATSLEEDLEQVLPLVADREGVLVATHRDRLATPAPEAVLRRLERDLGVPVVVLDARRATAEDRDAVAAALGAPGRFATGPVDVPAGWRARQRRGPLEHPAILAVAAILLLLAPAVGAVWAANAAAGVADPAIRGLLDPLLAWLRGAPEPLASTLAGDYGIVAMLPFLLVWALPTVILFSLLIGVLKASGLLELVCAGLHPLVRPLGLSGRDLAPFVMGYGCNVPAVVKTRACAACTRGQAVGAIAFGSACSYQLGATGAVLAATGRGWLTAPFVLVLLTTTVLYAAATRPRRRGPLAAVLDPRAERVFVSWPAWGDVRREAAGTLRQFATRAMPIFVLICLVASLLQLVGGLDAAASLLRPLMGAFGLPGDAALGVVLASVRKDGILLLGEGSLAASLTGLQLLSAVYLAGVLLPCLVTSRTVARELSAAFALRLVARQAAFACGFTLLLAWGGRAAGLG